MLFALFHAVGWQSAIIFFVVFLLGFYWIRLPKNLPPGPSGWPAIGSLLAIKSRPPYVVFTEWSKRYGVVFSVRLGRKLLVILNDVRCIKEALHKQADVFSDRSVTNVSKYIGIKGNLLM